MKMRYPCNIVAALALVGAAYPAMAIQIPPGPVTMMSSTSEPATPPQQRTPQQGVAQPWVSSCRGDGAQRVCDTVQSLVDTTTQREVVRVAFAKQTTTGRVGILVKTPLGMRLDTGAMLRINGETSGSVEGLIYSRCLGDGCYAEKPLSASEIAKIRIARSIDLLMLNLQGSPVIIPIAIEGLSSKLDGL